MPSIPSIFPDMVKSDGKRGYVERFSNYVDDVKTYYDMVKQQNKDTKIFLVGHSMGALLLPPMQSNTRMN